jgi:hypothetical protein
MNLHLKSLLEDTNQETDLENVKQIEEDTYEEEVKEEIKNDEDIISNDIIDEEIQVKEIEIEDRIYLTPFNKWIRENINNLDDVKLLGIQTAGIDIDKTIVVKTLDSKKDFAPDGEPLNRLIVFEYADKIRVFDKPGINIKIFTNDCTDILYDMYGDEKTETSYILRSYRMKSFITGVLNYNINNLIIPVYVKRVKLRENYLSIPQISYQSIVDKINQPLDKEYFEINYKQCTKVIDNMNSTMDILKWLINKKESIIDINHIIYIDKMIASFLTS